MEYKEHVHPQKKNEEVQQEVASRKAGDNGMFLEDNRAATPIQQKTVDALEHKSIGAPIQKKENNTGLPDTLKSGIENLSGYAMDDVKVHYNSNKPSQLNAHAYAQGTDIHLGSGQEQHLAHEAWHVVQQKQGRVQPTKQLKSKVNINDDEGLETEADVMGAKALQFQSQGRTSVLQTVTIPKKTAQRYIVPDAEVAGSFTSQVSRDKVGGGKTFLNDAGDAATLETKEASKVRVAVSGKMAVEDSDKGARQAKFFYADANILTQANDAMKSIDSPISFMAGGHTINVKDQEGGNHQLSLIIPIQNEGNREAVTGTDIRIPENCNEAVCTITNLMINQNMFQGKMNPSEDTINAPSGKLSQDLVLRLATFLPAYLKVKKYEDSSGLMGVFNSLFKKPDRERELLTTARDTSLEGRDKITGHDEKLSSSQDASKIDRNNENKKDTIENIAKNYADNFLAQPESKAIIDQLGINESAAPNAGDALGIYTIGNSRTKEEGEGINVMDYRTGELIDNPASFHYATVIARSGTDYITMENYARQKEEADDHAPVDLDPRYFFRMYGPEAQSFHSENESQYPNAMTLALSKPVQQVAQLQSDAPIQFSDEEDAVEEVRATMTDGPGNQTGSSKKAKENFDIASQLEDLLFITKNQIDNSDENKGLKGLGGDALYRKNAMYGSTETSVSSYVDFTSGGKERAKQHEIAEKLNNLTEIVWRNFVLQKTGGGSCDHISAATFLNLVEKGKKPVLISYEPQSDEEYKITPPSEEYNKHRSVLVKEEKEGEDPVVKEVDPWFPKEDGVDIFESNEAAAKKLKNVNKIWEWEPDDKEFVEAVQKELEVRFKELKKGDKLKELTGNSESIKALWDITEKEDEDI